MFFVDIDFALLRMPPILIEVLKHRRALCSGVFLLTLLNVNAVEFYTEKPSYLPSCKIYQPGFTNCSTHSIQKLLDALAEGIPEVTAKIGPLEPMKIDHLIFKQDNNDVVTIRANITDLLVKGFSNLHIKESRVSKKDFHWRTKILLPHVRLEGNYKMKGKILLIPLSGAGEMFIELDNLDLLLYTTCRLYEKGGFTFYNVTKVNVNRLNIKGLKTYFNNLFNGANKEIERSTNEFFNENWEQLFEALKPIVQETTERLLTNLLQTTFHLIPANFLVEDIPTSQQLYGKNT